MLPEENAEQVRDFLTRTPDAVLVPLGSNDTPGQPGLQLLPGEGQMDGFYYARLLKSEHSTR